MPSAPEIIDEVHPLVHQYRGRHLAFLFTRLSRRTRTPIQKIAMSATIARVREVMGFFDFRPEATSLAVNTDRRISARLVHLKNGDTEMISLLNDLYHAWNYKKILIFCNSRSACDRFSGILGRSGVFRNVTELHYSNLKPRERKKAEDRFRKNPHALCIATSTLELGIDVGDVDAGDRVHLSGRRLVPLSIFWKTLPMALMVEEIADFFFDRRVAEAFARYLASSSDIVSGDMADFAGPHPSVEKADESATWEIDAGASLLDREKQKVPASEALPFSSPRWQRPCFEPGRSLTATMVSDYVYFGPGLALGIHRLTTNQGPIPDSRKDPQVRFNAIPGRLSQPVSHPGSDPRRPAGPCRSPASNPLPGLFRVFRLLRRGPCP